MQMNLEQPSMFGIGPSAAQSEYQPQAHDPVNITIGFSEANSVQEMGDESMLEPSPAKSTQGKRTPPKTRNKAWVGNQLLFKYGKGDKK